MTELVEQAPFEAPERFKAMAADIEHNGPSKFGGAVVIIPPANGGEAIELLMLDLKADPAQFWATIKTRIEIKLAEFDESRRSQNTFGRR